MGGQAPAAMRAAIAYCDGWMPTVCGEAFFAKLGEFRELLALSVSNYNSSGHRSLKEAVAVFSPAV